MCMYTKIAYKGYYKLFYKFYKYYENHESELQTDYATSVS